MCAPGCVLKDDGKEHEHELVFLMNIIGFMSLYYAGDRVNFYGNYSISLKASKDITRAFRTTNIGLNELD